MNRFIAYCGLNCEKCDAYLATVHNDSRLREKTAQLWSELNGAPITPEMINCTGCRMEGPKTPFCESLCPIRQCAKAKQFETCADCAELSTCEKAAMILADNEEARRNLEEMKK
jgi:hypothetical protein